MAIGLVDPVLFLDVDGVLNHEAIYRSGSKSAPLCLHCIARFHRLVAETQCRVVLSSSWRGVPSLERHLSRAGVFHRAHKDKRTIQLANGLDACRGREIAEWLSRHPDVTRYAIVDDEPVVLPKQWPYFVQTSFKTGLLDAHVRRLSSIMSVSAGSPDFNAIEQPPPRSRRITSARRITRP